jgi:hypothetical protein
MAEERPTARNAFEAMLAEMRWQTTVLELLQVAIQTPRRWEYMVVIVQAQKERWYEYYGNGVKLSELDNKPIHVVLNTLGEQGWELVGILRSGDFYFKRALSS